MFGKYKFYIEISKSEAKSLFVIMWLFLAVCIGVNVTIGYYIVTNKIAVTAIMIYPLIISTVVGLSLGCRLQYKLHKYISGK